jgi:GNAT superfamily N-acetyltransferase
VADATLRRPTEDDQPRLAGVVDHWFGGRRVWPLLARSWFRHFAGTSWILEDADGAPIGFLIGFLSPGRPEEAVLHLIAVEPNQRRRGVGRRLVAAFLDDATTGGARTVRAVGWPDDRVAYEFFRALGFQPDDGPGSQNLYGLPGWPDYEFPGEDRVILVRPVDHPA